MNITETKALINEGYNRLYVLTNLSHTDYRQEMLDYERKLVKDWRLRTQDTWHVSVDWLLNMTTEAKFFCVQHILNALQATEPLTIKSVLHCKDSYITAHSLVANYRDKIEEAFAGFDIEAFNNLNSTDFKTEVV